MTAPHDVDTAAVGPLPTLFSQTLETPSRGSVHEVGSDEAAHLRAMRARPGDVVAVTDGRGSRWRGEVVEVERRRARVRLLAPLPAPPPAAVTLVAPVGNRDRSLWLVEKATELGVEAIRWVELERSRSVEDAGRSEGFVERAARRAVSALKQCGGAWLPRLYPPEDLASVLTTAEEGERRWLGEAHGAPALVAADGVCGGDRVTILVGPEGGLTPAERDACTAAGYRPVGVGERTLRFETAAIALTAVAVTALEGKAET